MYIHIYIYTCVCVYVYLCMYTCISSTCVFVYVLAWWEKEKERERERGRGNKEGKERERSSRSSDRESVHLSVHVCIHLLCLYTHMSNIHTSFAGAARPDKAPRQRCCLASNVPQQPSMAQAHWLSFTVICCWLFHEGHHVDLLYILPVHDPSVSCTHTCVCALHWHDLTHRDIWSCVDMTYMCICVYEDEERREQAKFTRRELITRLAKRIMYHIKRRPRIFLRSQRLNAAVDELCCRGRAP